MSQKYHLKHPDSPDNSPEVLMVGFRAAGWTLCTAAAASLFIALVGLRDIGIVGQHKKSETEVQETKIPRITAD